MTKEVCPRVRVGCQLALVLGCVFGATSAGVVAEDWRMFGRDATHNGVSPEKHPPLDWEVRYPEDKNRVNKNIKWTASLGSATYGDPVIADGLVWVGTNGFLKDFDRSHDGTTLLCLRESDGKQFYQYFTPRLGESRNDWLHDWDSSSLANSPLVEGDRLWFTTNRAEVVCLDIGALRRGAGEPKVAWKLDMYRDLNVRQFGTDGTDIKHSSVAGYKDWIYVTTGEAAVPHGEIEKPGPAPSLICLEKATGKIVWKDDLPRDAILEYQPGSPLVAEIAGRAQVIVGQGDGWLRSSDPSSGKLLWKFDMNPKASVWSLDGDRNMIPSTPVLYDNKIYLASGRGYHRGFSPARLCCIDPTRSGDISADLSVDAKGREIPHRTTQAVDAALGEKAIANPNSGLVWQFTGASTKDDDLMSGMIANVAIANDLVIAPDIAGRVHCLDAKSGKQHWMFDAMAALYASPLIVGGYIYIADEDGDVATLRLSADPKVAMPRGQPIFETSAGSAIFCAPVYANGVLYIATRNRLIAIAEKQQAPRPSNSSGKP